MDAAEATDCARLIQAKYCIPIHTGAGGVFSDANIAKFTVGNKVVVKPGETIQLKTD